MTEPDIAQRTAWLLCGRRSRRQCVGRQGGHTRASCDLSPRKGTMMTPGSAMHYISTGDGVGLEGRRTPARLYQACPAWRTSA
eukprot:452104-Rhodomonas_salina.3